MWFLPFLKVKENKVKKSVPAVTTLTGAFDNTVVFLVNFILEQEIQVFVCLEKWNRKGTDFM